VTNDPPPPLPRPPWRVPKVLHRSVGAWATLAILWEITAPKPGNVHRGADFEDVSYVDFLTAAAVVGPSLERAAEWGVGRTVLTAVRATRDAVASNTNLGTLLLLAPLAAVSTDRALDEGIKPVLAGLTKEDTRQVYEAIQIAQPGGLGNVDWADVRAARPPDIALVAAMEAASARDNVARQYVTEFELVFQTADRIAAAVAGQMSLSAAIVHGFLELLAQWPDSLIARKTDLATARDVSNRAAVITDKFTPASDPYMEAVAQLDFFLRASHHRLNPGTTADLVAAALFVLLREGRLQWPVHFYPEN
jgi:triphosphoribosyl-dephospho-CoA synthase